MISPTVFIPIAERSGLINSPGALGHRRGLRAGPVWREPGLRMRVAINLSGQQLRQADLPARIAAALAKHQINPDLLTCEITESVAMENTDATHAFFTNWRPSACTSRSTTSARATPAWPTFASCRPPELKIDRGFVMDLENSEGARKIAEAVVNLAQALNMKVVAEGVETDGQYQILRRLGCDQVQGFLFAKPMTARALALWATGCEGPRRSSSANRCFQETAVLAG